MSKLIFEKTIKNVRKFWNIKLLKTDKRRNHLVLEPNYETTKWCSENLLAIEINKINVTIEKFSNVSKVEVDSEGDRPLPIGKYKKVIWPMKYKLGGKIMKEFVALILKICSVPMIWHKKY